MQTDNRLLDDLARVAGGALGALQGVKGEVTARLRDQFERVLADLDLVTREEFDAVKKMAAAARRENEALAARVAALEAELRPSKTRRGAAGTAAGKAKKGAKRAAKSARAGSERKAASRAKSASKAPAGRAARATKRRRGKA